MNKWIKHGMAGLLISTTTISAAATTKNSASAREEELTNVSVDALDLAGGSKLKDRMIQANVDEVEIVRAIILV